MGRECESRTPLIFSGATFLTAKVVKGTDKGHLPLWRRSIPGSGYSQARCRRFGDGLGGGGEGGGVLHGEDRAVGCAGGSVARSGGRRKSHGYSRWVMDRGERRPAVLEWAGACSDARISGCSDREIVIVGVSCGQARVDRTLSLGQRRTGTGLERETGFEPATACLEGISL